MGGDRTAHRVVHEYRENDASGGAHADDDNRVTVLISKVITEFRQPVSDPRSAVGEEQRELAAPTELNRAPGCALLANRTKDEGHVNDAPGVEQDRCVVNCGLGQATQLMKQDHRSRRRGIAGPDHLPARYRIRKSILGQRVDVHALEATSWPIRGGQSTRHWCKKNSLHRMWL